MAHPHAYPEPAPRLPDITSVDFERMVRECAPAIPSSNPPAFAMLSSDVAMCILDQLRDPVDRVCFALTSKALWMLMHGILLLDQFNIPPVLPPRVTLERGIINRWPFFSSLRWRLLERIEDSYWKCCSGCLRLHPKHEFFYGELHQQPPRERLCKIPGLIQMCPHIYLTYKKCAKLHKALLDLPPPGENAKMIGNIPMHEKLRHECHLVADNVKLTFTMQPYLSVRYKQLMCHNTFNVKGFEAGKLKEALEKFCNSVFLPCPHRSILAHCKDMALGGRWDSDMVDGDCDNTSQAMCIACGTTYMKFQTFTHSVSRRQMHEFVARRYIGDFVGIRECQVIGRGDPDRLQSWLNRTNLSNVIKVDCFRDYCPSCGGTDARRCQRLAFVRIGHPSWKSSLPGISWKEIH